jgi:high-affinity iron transporter
MGILAVILIGKGVHSLQETGAISITGISMFRIELLGIYPTIETCIAQLAIAGIVFYIWNFSAKPAKPSA